MDCLTMFKAGNNVQNFLQYVMPLWKKTKFRQCGNKTRNVPRGLSAVSTIDKWSYSFNAHAKKMLRSFQVLQ